MIVAKHAIAVLPRRVVIQLSRFLGTSAYYLAPKLRKIARANLDAAFGDSKTLQEKVRISKSSFRNFSLVLLDSFWFGRHTEKRLRKYLRYDSSFRVYLEQPPIIAITAHLGNWEIMGLGCGLEGQPITAIAMPLKNSFADRELNRLRVKTGTRITPRSGAVRHLIRSLRAGNNTLLLLDQNTLPEEGGMFVPFFGLSVPVSKAAASLMARTQARLMVIWCLPDAQGVYTAYALPPFPNEGESPSAEAITARLTQELESVIRKRPGSWLWSYKRWCFYQDSDDGNQYPFYRKSFEETMRRRAIRKQSSAK